MRVLLKHWRDLMMKEGLLYTRVLFAGHDQPIAQFVLPEPFKYNMVLASHDDFGLMGMERTLGLLQERFFWNDCNKNVCVLIVIDHFTRYAAAYITPKQTAPVVAKVLWKNFLVNYG